MKKCNYFIGTLLMALCLAGCKRTFEVNDVYVSPNDELCNYLENEFEMAGEFGSKANIIYKSKHEVAVDSCWNFEEYGDEAFLCLRVDDINDDLDYTIISCENGGYKLAVEASLNDNSTSPYSYSYKKITLVHPSSTPYDSIVCTNLKFKAYQYDRWDGYYNRPCAGRIKVYRVDGKDKFLSKEMVEATDEKTIWKEYYQNGNEKRVKTIMDAPEDELENDAFNGPFTTNYQYYFEDGELKTIENLIYRQHGNYAVFKCDYSFKGKRIWAIFLKEKRMIVFVESNNINKELTIALCYEYEIRDNILRFYNGYEIYGFGTEVEHYPETSAEIFIDKDGDGVSFTNMQRYGAMPYIHISASLSTKTLPNDLLDFVKEYTNRYYFKGWN